MTSYPFHTSPYISSQRNKLKYLGCGRDPAIGGGCRRNNTLRNECSGNTLCVVGVGAGVLSTVEAGIGLLRIWVIRVGGLFMLVSVGLSPLSPTLLPRCRTSFSGVLAKVIKNMASGRLFNQL